MLVRHPIFAETTTQTVISLLSGEVEFYAAVRGACRTLGLTALMLDLGFSMQAELRTDSTEGFGITTRSWTGATHPLPSPMAATEHSHRERSWIDTLS